MQKVLYYSSQTHRQGGAIALMFKLADHFNCHPDFEVVAVLPNRNGIAQDYIESNIPLRIIPFMALGAHRSLSHRLRYAISLLGTIREIAKLIKHEDVDLVHVNEVTFFPALLAARFARVPTICHVRVILRDRFPLARLVLGQITSTFSDYIISSSHATSRGLFDTPGPQNLVVSYDGGPDRTRLDPALYERDDLRQRYGFTNYFVIGLVSKLIPVKGHRHLIEAGALLRRRHPDIPWKFVFVGGKVEGYESYAAALKRRADRLGIGDRVAFMGRRHDIPQLFYALDVAVHVPDHDDPFPGVVLEALMMERPLVATASGGIPEQFRNGSSGILIEKGDVESLASELAHLADDSHRRCQMGRAGREHVLANFSPERHFSEVEAIYRELLGIPI